MRSYEPISSTPARAHCYAAGKPTQDFFETITITALACPALAALRDATRALHADLDQRSPLTGEQLDIPAYARHAQRVLGWMQPLEAQLYGRSTEPTWQAALAAEQRRQKAGWLQQDLHDSGFTTAVQQCHFTPQPHSLAEAFGASYVCEGATLGGSYLYKQWHERLQPLRLHWLRGYGEHTGALWRQWQQALAAHVTTPADIQAAAETAVAAFASFKRWVIESP